MMKQNYVQVNTVVIEIGSDDVSENQSDLHQFLRANMGFRKLAVYSQITKSIQNLQHATLSNGCYFGQV
jgi:hypothetical protein